MLEWHVSSDVAEKCLDAEIIDIIKRIPEKIPNSCLDENVSILKSGSILPVMLGRRSLK